MDQSKKDIQDLRELQIHLREAASLRDSISSSEERIRKGTTEEYVFCDEEVADEVERRQEKCASENRSKLDSKEKKLKIFRVCLVVIFFVIMAILASSMGETAPGESAPDWFVAVVAIGGWTCIGYWIATVVIINKMDYSGRKFSAKQKAWIEEGARIDQETKKRNEQAYEAAREASFKEQREFIAELKRDLPELRKELTQHQAAINASDVLGSKDKNLETVGYLINQIANKRANSIQEALLQLDEKKAKEQEEKARLAHYQFMYDMQRQAEGQRAVREAEEYMRQTFHNLEMQKQARRQTEELERIRRELENS
jgi:hypothetical protein